MGYNKVIELDFKDKEGRKLTGNQVKEKLLNRFKNILLEFQVFLLHLVGLLPSHSLRKIYYQAASIELARQV